MERSRKSGEAMKQKKEGEKMGYLEFVSEIAAIVQERVGMRTKVTLKETECNNGTIRKGISIYGGNGNAVPVIHLEYYYKRYLDGMGLDEAAGEVHALCLESMRMDTSIFRDYETVKERVLFRLVNYKMNAGLLREVPHQKYLDLAVVFYCQLAEDEKRWVGSVLIRNEHLALWGVTQRVLAERAYENTPRLLGHQVLNMAQLIQSLMPYGESGEIPEHGDEPLEMLILTNPSRTNGAACMLYPKLLEGLAEKKKSSFVILPSSVHEVILVPVADGIGEDELAGYTQMVQEVNQTELEWEEVLSDHAYFYDRSRAEVCIV